MSGLRKESRNDSVAGSSTMLEPAMMNEGEEYFNTGEPSTEWTESTACSQLCRMCATENEYLIPIFDGEGVEHQLGMKIEKHLPIRVHVDDTLPLQVCYQCASTLIAWHDLVVGCIEAEKKLLQLQSRGQEGAQEEEVEDVKTTDTTMFYEEPMATEPANDPIGIEASTSSAPNVQIRLPPKKTVPKSNPKLKMVIMKSPAASGGPPSAPTARIITPKTEGNPDTTERSAAAATAARPGADSSQHTLIPVQCVCAHCGLAFSFVNELAAHLASKHQVSIYHCDICNELIQGSKQKFIEHSKTHMPASSAQPRVYFPCGDCGKEFPRKCDVLRHMRTHEPALAHVPHSPRLAPTGSEIDGFPCPLCPKVLSRKHDLKRHVFYSHKSDWPDSNVWKPTPKVKELHAPCPVCSRVFSRKYDMRRHLGKRHPEHSLALAHAVPAIEIGDPHDLLEAFFTQQAGTSANVSARSKAKENDSYCPVCSRLFARKWDMIRHLTKVHPEFDGAGEEGDVPPAEGDPPSIKQLERYFTRKADRSFFKRAKQKAGESVPCPVCAHVFSRKYDMIRHLKVHPDHDREPIAAAPPVPSALSAERLASDREVDAARVATDDGQTHFQCRHCGQNVAQRYAFVRHLRIHSGERPFTCHVCGVWTGNPQVRGGSPSSCAACAHTAASRFPSPRS